MLVDLKTTEIANTYCTMPKRQYRREKLPTRISTIGPKKVSYYLGIFYNNNKNLRPQNKYGKMVFWPKFFPDCETQISQQHFFIICQDAQTPHQVFSQISTQMAPPAKVCILFLLFFGQ